MKGVNIRLLLRTLKNDHHVGPPVEAEFGKHRQ